MKTVVYSGTRNLYLHMIPAVKSLLYNSNIDQVYLLIQDDIFPYQLPKNVITKNVNNQQYFSSTGPNIKSHFTYMAMMRAALAKIFPNQDLILSLDVDTIVNQDISDLWNLPMDNYYFAASKQPLTSKGGTYYKCDLYTNTGVALYNLKKLRDDKKVDQIINKLEHQYYPFVQQDCFNFNCQGHILTMLSDYNANDWVEPYQERKITHFAAIPLEQWTKFPEVQKYRNMTWEEIYNKRKEMK